ncbi:acireductone dioxygenase [Candidatus Sumerlaeota bacterium]|nr:acireductone dioxygenase [Candidatus Sumerlaeota bacterium]
MAKLKLENEEVISDINRIAAEMAPLGIKLHRWEISCDPAVKELIGRQTLTDAEKAIILSAHDHYFNELAKRDGYQTRDLIVIHEQVPNIDAMLAKFDKCHTHAEDEVRFIIDGEGVFGFVRPDGSQVEMLIEPGEYINVPVGTEHWFHLTPKKRIKAIRYFTSTAGWTPEYTGTSIRIPAIA